MFNENIDELIKLDIVPDMIRKNAFSGITNKNWSIKTIDIVQMNTDDGTFMLTNCKKLKIIFENLIKSNEIKEFNLVVKVTPAIDDEFYKSANFDALFENEIRAYTEILPIINEGIDCINYYYSYRYPLKACIVIEDFSYSNWKMAPSLTNLSLDHILVAVRELGRFHGKAYALKLLDNERFMDTIKHLRESRFANDELNPMYALVLNQGQQRAYRAVRESEIKSNIPEEFLEKLENLIKDTIRFGRKIVQPKEPLAVLCHGDFLRNNIAFKYEKNKNTGQSTAIKALMFDYQTLRYSSPMVDLVVFMMVSTNYETRNRHFCAIFDTYFNQLMATLKKDLNGKKEVPDYINHDDLMKEYAKYLVFGFSIATGFVPILLRTQDIDMSKFADFSPESIEILKNFINTSGGKALDREFYEMINEIYKYSQKYNLNLFDE